MIKQVFEDRTYIIEYPPSSFPNDFSCESLTGFIIYLDDNENSIELHNFSNKDFFKDFDSKSCRLRFDI